MYMPLGQGNGHWCRLYIEDRKKEQTQSAADHEWYSSVCLIDMCTDRSGQVQTELCLLLQCAERTTPSISAKGPWILLFVIILKKCENFYDFWGLRCSISSLCCLSIKLQHASYIWNLWAPSCSRLQNIFSTFGWHFLQSETRFISWLECDSFQGIIWCMWIYFLPSHMRHFPPSRMRILFRVAGQSLPYFETPWKYKLYFCFIFIYLFTYFF